MRNPIKRPVIHEGIVRSEAEQKGWQQRLVRFEYRISRLLSWNARLGTRNNGKRSEKTTHEVSYISNYASFTRDTSGRSQRLNSGVANALWTPPTPTRLKFNSRVASRRRPRCVGPTQFATSSRQLPTDLVDNLETDQTDSIAVYANFDR